MNQPNNYSEKSQRAPFFNEDQEEQYKRSLVGRRIMDVINDYELGELVDWSDLYPLVEDGEIVDLMYGDGYRVYFYTSRPINYKIVDNLYAIMNLE